MKKLLLVVCISLLSPVQASLPKKALRTLTNGLFYLIASSDASDKTTSQAQDLLKKVDPSKKLLAVRKFNRFGKFLFGDHNTITVPYLNYVVVDNEGMENLSEESRKFVLGRCMMTLRHPEKYLIYKYALPFFMQQVYNTATTQDEQDSAQNVIATLTPNPTNAIRHGKLLREMEDDDKPRSFTTELNTLYSSNKQTAKQAAYPLGVLAATSFLGNYFSRGIEYELDAKTAHELQCKDAAIDYLGQINPFKFSRFAGLYAYMGAAMLASWLSTEIKQKNKSFKSNTSYTAAIGLNYFYTFVALSFHAVKKLPGQNSDENKAGGYDSWIPFIGKLFGTFPNKYDRIKALGGQMNTTTSKDLEPFNELE